MVQDLLDIMGTAPLPAIASDAMVAVATSKDPDPAQLIADLAPVYQIPAGVTVFAVSEADAARKIVWGRCLKRETTTRVNRFTDADLVEVMPTGYVFRLPSNRRGYALLMVPADSVRIAA